MKPIDLALRNKKILAWYKALPLIGSDGAITRSRLVVEYARELNCPLSEIVMDMQGDDDLDFLWLNYHREIEDSTL